MGRFFFSGSSEAKLDEKGRFVLPQKMRLGLVEEGSADFTLGLGVGGCLTIYRQSDIEKIVEKFEKQQHIGQYQKFFTFFFSTLHQTTYDSVGRVMIPANLKKIAGIKTEIAVVGVMKHIEIWSLETYRAQQDAIISGKDPETNLVKLAEQAFAILGNDTHG